MNLIFDSMRRRFEKLSDTYTDEYKGKLLISRDVVLAILEDEKKYYNETLWNSLCYNRYPWQEFGESSRPVLVKFNEITDPVVCTYDFTTRRFMFLGEDVTDKVKEWCEIPGYGYDG